MNTMTFTKVKKKIFFFKMAVPICRNHTNGKSHIQYYEGRKGCLHETGQ